MAAQRQESLSALTAVTGIAGILFGIIIGYVIGSGQARTASVAAAPSVAAEPAPGVVSDSELQAYRNVLAADPKNTKAAEALGNKLYDAGRYAEAVPYYRQALSGDPKNVSISTDLGTALYYAGSIDEALTQLTASLAIDPNHAQTLFNLGIVRRDGKKDAKGAIDAWERLLSANPNYPEAAKVRSLISETPRS
jgi:cytochrome c-type biogenesis protein CcmH/NrfG